MRSLVAVWVLLIAGYGSRLATEAGTQAEPQRNEIVNLLQQHDDAMNHQDLEGLLALYSPGPKTVILGTGPGERYQGTDEIRAAYLEFFKDFDKGTQSRECYWKDGDINGNSAWIAANCKFTDSLKKKPREYELNVSGALQKANGKWQFSMLHFSELIGAPKNNVAGKGVR
jgi:ketosteroid isomerase-like protein